MGIEAVKSRRDEEATSVEEMLRTELCITPGIVSSVNAYLMTRTLAEVTRSRVDAIQREVLGEIKLFTDRMMRHGGDIERITDPRNVYLSEDRDGLDDYYYECDKREKAAGIKPINMLLAYCPALRAEHLQTACEHLLIGAVSEAMFPEREPSRLAHGLLCMGLDKYKHFIDLTVSMVVSAPGYKNPLTGKLIE